MRHGLDFGDVHTLVLELGMMRSLRWQNHGDHFYIASLLTRWVPSVERIVLPAGIKAEYKSEWASTTLEYFERIQPEIVFEGMWMCSRPPITWFEESPVLA